MKRVWTCALAALVGLMVAGVGNAQVQDTGDENLDSKLSGLIAGSFLEVLCTVPDIQPRVCNLRSNFATDKNKLISVFFGEQSNINSTDDIRHPIWGKGRRYKSGVVIHLIPKEGTVQQMASPTGQELELVPAFLDAYGPGFIYVNNGPQKPVYATNVKKKGDLDADITHHYVYRAPEGQAAAEEMVKEMFGELASPDGFQESVQAVVKENQDQLFYYRVNPQYLTTYDVTSGIEADSEGNITPIVVGTRDVAVPVMDRYVQVILDADKMLSGMEYFWDSKMAAVGQPKQCITASDAVMKARTALYEEFDGQPPFVSVRDIKLGFVQDRSDTSLLIPAWIFDAAYSRRATPEEQAASGVIAYSHNLVLVPIPFAVNALTGEPFLL